ncbi:hypothetical protein COU54_04115 [Candidatus Pacearchaeota archaeon CG10_big_fil_rev_8_21_14_0_10_31_24]|nr:MAG: hypothetical protein COU54_04115 [Candidatus Pacearchaeota archaeon CG10_big_fil_rev_8_21_14_0_10_31_24]
MEQMENPYETLEGLINKFKSISFPEKRTPINAQLKIDPQKIETHLSEPDSAYFLIDSDYLTQFYVSNTFTPDYYPLELEECPITELIHPRDKEIFIESINTANKDQNITGFEFGIGCYTPQNQLTHYNLEAQLCRYHNQIQQIQLFIRKSKTEWSLSTENTPIDLEELLKKHPLEKIKDEIGKKLSSSNNTHPVIIKLNNSKFPKDLIPVIGNLMKQHENLSLIGARSLSDEVYTAFRHPTLDLPRERLSIKRLIYYRKNSKFMNLLGSLWAKKKTGI